MTPHSDCGASPDAAAEDAAFAHRAGRGGLRRGGLDREVGDGGRLRRALRGGGPPATPAGTAPVVQPTR